MSAPLDRLAALPEAEPSPVRAARVRAVARRRLTPRRPAEPVSASARRRGPLLWLTAGVSGVYLAKVVAVALEVLAARLRG